MADRIQELKAAIRAGTVFDTGLTGRLDGVIAVATAYAEQTNNDVEAYTAGLKKLRDHVVDTLDNLPARLAAIKVMSTTEVDLNPYMGSLLGAADQIALAENGFLVANQEATDLVEWEIAANEAAMIEVEALAYAMELNEMLKDPLGQAVLAAVGGPVVQTALVAEHQAFLDLYGFDTTEVDDGSIIGDDDPDDCPCC